MHGTMNIKIISSVFGKPLLTAEY